MNQEFYTREILPLHIKEIKALQKRHKRRYHLQEDSNSSHGNSSQNNPPARLKRDTDLLILTHPAQSPNLNPIKACWNIMKSRLHRRKWSTIAHFKADIQAEWNQVTIAQIRCCIREMPQRCLDVQANGGERVKSDLW
jgi:hypothetical protein